MIGDGDTPLPENPNGTGGHSGPARKRRKQLLHRFEDAWEQGRAPSVDDFLLPDSDPESLPLLIDLLHVDLERRLERGEVVRVEQYFHRFPELGEDANVLLEMIVAEFEVRSRRESPLLFAEYCQRFPDLCDPLRERFLALPGGDTAMGFANEPTLSLPP